MAPGASWVPLLHGSEPLRPNHAVFANDNAMLRQVRNGLICSWMKWPVRKAQQCGASTPCWANDLTPTQPLDTSWNTKPLHSNCPLSRLHALRLIFLEAPPRIDTGRAIELNEFVVNARLLLGVQPLEDICAQQDCQSSAKPALAQRPYHHIERARQQLCNLTFELSRPWRQGALADESNIVLGSGGQGALPERVGSSEGLGLAPSAWRLDGRGRAIASGVGLVPGKDVLPNRRK